MTEKYLTMGVTLLSRQNKAFLLSLASNLTGLTFRDWSKSIGGGGGGPENLEMWLIKNT